MTLLVTRGLEQTLESPQILLDCLRILREVSNGMPAQRKKVNTTSLLAPLGRTLSGL